LFSQPCQDRRRLDNAQLPPLLGQEFPRAILDGRGEGKFRPWMAQQARNLAMFFGDLPSSQKPTYIVRDRDTKFTTQFCSIVEADGIQFAETAPRSPNMNPFAERWIQSIRRECLDHFYILGENHLRFLVKTYVDYYLRFRPHQGVGNVTLPTAELPNRIESEPGDMPIGEIVCHDWLGGVLRHYERKAA